MKRPKKRTVQLVLLALLGGAIVFTLLLPTISAHKKQQEPLEISVIMRQTDNQLWSWMRMGMEQAAGDLGVELRFLIPTIENDSTEQEVLIQHEVQRGTNAIIVVPANNKQLQSKLPEITSNIPVIALESSIHPDEITITPDNAQIGESLAQLALQEGEGKAVLLANTCTTSDGIAQRTEQARKYLQEAGISVQIWPSSKYVNIDDLIKIEQVGQIIAMDASATVMIAEKYSEIENHPQLYGVGSAPPITAALDSGTLSAVAVWSEYASGYMAVEHAVKTVRGNAPQKLESLRFTIVKEDEIYETENQKLLFPITS